MGLTQFTMFPSFHFDSAQERLWCGDQEVTLRPKSLTVLSYLLAHPGRVIGKAELLAACWPEVCVSPAALKVCIREIRAALGDDADAPRFIETVPREGYRFIAPLTTPFHQSLESSVQRLETEHHNMRPSQVRTLSRSQVTFSHRIAQKTHILRGILKQECAIPFDDPLRS